MVELVRLATEISVTLLIHQVDTGVGFDAELDVAEAGCEAPGP